MAITAGMVKELREMTGAGMMDCKKALAETNGDMDAAVEFLRKNGQAKAEKKAGRIAAEGIVKTVVKDDKVAAIVEVNSDNQPVLLMVLKKPASLLVLLFTIIFVHRFAYLVTHDQFHRFYRIIITFAHQFLFRLRKMS